MPYLNRIVVMSDYYEQVENCLRGTSKDELNRFLKLSDNTKRFAYSNEIYKRFEEPKSPVNQIQKDKNTSTEYREKGNKFFKLGRYSEALSLYNKSVIHSPLNESCIPFAYSNRSAALHHLKRYHECVQDVDLAMSSGYPVANVYKLWDRRSKCNYAIGNIGQSREDLTKMIQALENSSLDPMAKTKLLNYCNKLIEERKGKCSSNILKQKKFSWPSLGFKETTWQSDKLGFTESEKLGRHARANSKLAAGEDVLAEMPYASVCNDPVAYCNRCYAPLATVARDAACARCVDVRYCSEECVSADSSGHVTLCGYAERRLRASRLGPIGRLAAEVLVKVGVPRLLSRDPPPDLYSRLERMVDSCVLRSGHNLLQYGLLACLIYKVLTPALELDKLDQRQRDFLGGRILHLLQVISCNAIEIYASRGKTKETIGLGIYLKASLLNHSCDPNLEIVFYGKKLLAQSIQSSGKNCELTISYGSHYRCSDRETRRNNLAGQYFFFCECEACLNNWEFANNKDKSKEIPPPLKCTCCGGPLFLKGKQTKVDCSHCGARQDAPFALQRYSESKNNLERAFRSQFTNHNSSPSPSINSNGASATRNNVSESTMKISVTPATPTHSSSTPCTPNRISMAPASATTTSTAPSTPNHNSVTPATSVVSSTELISALTSHLDVMDSVLTKPWKPFSDCIQKLAAILTSKGNTIQPLTDGNPI